MIGVGVCGRKFVVVPGGVFRHEGVHEKVRQDLQRGGGDGGGGGRGLQVTIAQDTLVG
jgi:hypothetical protein